MGRYPGSGQRMRRVGAACPIRGWRVRDRLKSLRRTDLRLVPSSFVIRGRMRGGFALRMRFFVAHDGRTARENVKYSRSLRRIWKVAVTMRRDHETVTKSEVQEPVTGP